MKTFKIALAAALISSPLAAETLDNTWSVGVFADYIKSSTNKENDVQWQQIEAGRGSGIDLQKEINEYWNARIELAQTRYDINNGGDTDNGTRFGIDAIYKLEDSGIYLFSGLKRFNNAKNYYAVDVGAGYTYQVNDNFSLYSEAVVYRDIDNGYTDQGIKFGLKYTFGSEKKAAPVAVVEKTEPVKVAPVAVAAKVAPLDSDNDGVIDADDRCENTSANVKVDATGCALYSDKTVTINLNVVFENNSAQIKTAVVNDIQRLADFMKEHPNTEARIEGHSSAVGNDKYNLTLSQKRADAVKTVLVDTFNIESSRLSAKGFGETQLLSEGNTKADHSLNRRVVAKVETTVKKVINK